MLRILRMFLSRSVGRLRRGRINRSKISRLLISLKFPSVRTRRAISETEGMIASMPVLSDDGHLEIHPSRLKAAILRGKTQAPVPSEITHHEANASTHRLQIHTRLKRCDGEIRLVLLGHDQEERLPQRDPNLLRAMAKAHGWVRQLISGEIASITEIAKRNGTSRSRAGSTLHLA